VRYTHTIGHSSECNAGPNLVNKGNATMATRGCKLVPYRRTSTDDQRLGIEAQDTTIQRIASERACEIVRCYTEHESGGNNDRPELDRAMRHARRVGAAVLVAKLDRLARDSAFLMKLYDSGVPIIFGDLPEIDGSAASRFMVQTMANVAEFERRRIGERTSEALQALKSQGKQLGTPENLTDADRAKGALISAQKSRARAIDDMSDVTPIASEMQREGASLRAIAERLNQDGYVTRKGAFWSATQVKRVLDRAMA
jgi:DNA invertase Pin-like site-specific DNA recombinase